VTSLFSFKILKIFTIDLDFKNRALIFFALDEGKFKIINVFLLFNLIADAEEDDDYKDDDNEDKKKKSGVD